MKPGVSFSDVQNENYGRQYSSALSLTTPASRNDRPETFGSGPRGASDESIYPPTEAQKEFSIRSGDGILDFKENDADFPNAPSSRKLKWWFIAFNLINVFIYALPIATIYAIDAYKEGKPETTNERLFAYWKGFCAFFVNLPSAILINFKILALLQALKNRRADWFYRISFVMTAILGVMNVAPGWPLSADALKKYDLPIEWCGNLLFAVAIATSRTYGLQGFVDLAHRATIMRKWNPDKRLLLLIQQDFKTHPEVLKAALKADPTIQFQLDDAGRPLINLAVIKAFYNQMSLERSCNATRYVTHAALVPIELDCAMTVLMFLSLAQRGYNVLFGGSKIANNVGLCGVTAVASVALYMLFAYKSPGLTVEAFHRFSHKFKTAKPTLTDLQAAGLAITALGAIMMIAFFSGDSYKMEADQEVMSGFGSVVNTLILSWFGRVYDFIKPGFGRMMQCAAATVNYGATLSLYLQFLVQQDRFSENPNPPGLLKVIFHHLTHATHLESDLLPHVKTREAAIDALPDKHDIIDMQAAKAAREKGMFGKKSESPSESQQGLLREDEDDGEVRGYGAV